MNRPLSKVLGLAIAVTVLGSTSVYGDAWIPPYPNNTFTYRINEASFTTNLTNLSLSAAQARYWVRWSLAQWGAFSGSTLITSEGPTTTKGDQRGECSASVGYSFIGAVDNYEEDEQADPLCGPDPDCSVAQATATIFQANGRLSHTQICIWGATSDWEVDADSMAGYEKDLVGVLTHELGHALGLGHENFSGVMDGTSLGVGNTLARIPFGADIQDLRATWGNGVNALRVAKYDDGGEFEWVTISNNAVWRRYGATIMEHPSTNDAWVIYSGPSPSGSNVHFHRTRYPVTAASVWENRSMGLGGTWVAPRMVSNNESTLAAWPRATTWHGECPAIVVARSSDIFQSASTIVLEDSCTMHPVSVAWDPVKNRYVMAYLRYSTTNSQNNRIMMRVSETGFTWSTPKDIGVRSIVAPSVACSDGECALVYNYRAEGTLYHRAFTVNPANNTVSVSSTLTTLSQRGLAPPAIAGRTLSQDILMAWSATNTTDVRFEPAAVVPVTFDDQYYVSSGARYGGEIGVFADPPWYNYNPHIFYVIR
jgi:hypothetical protein